MPVQNNTESVVECGRAQWRPRVGDGEGEGHHSGGVLQQPRGAHPENVEGPGQSESENAITGYGSVECSSDGEYYGEASIRE